MARVPRTSQLDSCVDACVVLGRIGSDADSAVPHLIEVLETSKSSAARSQAIEAPGKVAREAEKAVPAPIRALDEDSLRLKALGALRDFGPAAIRAIPAIEGLLGSGDPIIERLAREAIARIQGRKS
jgi:HEAT repeat protein